MRDLSSTERYEKLLDVIEASTRPLQGSTLRWRDLDRPARKALSRILGGGSLRAIAPETVQELRGLALIEVDRGPVRLTAAGWEVLRSSREWLRAGPEAPGVG
jgi:hypothetical protein